MVILIKVPVGFKGIWKWTGKGPWLWKATLGVWRPRRNRFHGRKQAQLTAVCLGRGRLLAAVKCGPNVSSKIALPGDLPVWGEIMDRALPASPAREPHFLHSMSIPKWVCLPMLVVFLKIIINTCLHWCQFGQEKRRKNQGLLTTRSPCDTTFHSIKEVKVLLPWVWFTREKEREKVVMSLRYWARMWGNRDNTTWHYEDASKPDTLPSAHQPQVSSGSGGNKSPREGTHSSPYTGPGGYEALGKMKASV